MLIDMLDTLVFELNLKTYDCSTHVCWNFGHINCFSCADCTIGTHVCMEQLAKLPMHCDTLNKWDQDRHDVVVVFKIWGSLCLQICLRNQTCCYGSCLSWDQRINILQLGKEKQGKLTSRVCHAVCSGCRLHLLQFTTFCMHGQVSSKLGV